MAIAYGNVIEIKSNLRKTSWNESRPQFSWRNFNNKYNVRATIQFGRKSSIILKKFFFFKNRPINFHINSISISRVIRPIKQNKLIFFSFGIYKLLPLPIHNVS